MLEQLPDGHAVLRSAGEFGNELRDGVVQRDLALVVKDHDRRRGGDHFRERCEIVDGLVRIDFGAVPIPSKLAETLFPNGGAASPNDYCRTRVAAGGNAALNDMIDLGEPSL